MLLTTTYYFEHLFLGLTLHGHYFYWHFFHNIPDTACQKYTYAAEGIKTMWCHLRKFTNTDESIRNTYSSFQWAGTVRPVAIRATAATSRSCSPSCRSPPSQSRRSGPSRRRRCSAHLVPRVTIISTPCRNILSLTVSMLYALLRTLFLAVSTLLRVQVTMSADIGPSLILVSFLYILEFYTELFFYLVLQSTALIIAYWLIDL